MDQHAGRAEAGTEVVPDLGSADGFSRWVAPHWSAMARLAARLSDGAGWEDVLQEALATAWRKRAQFDAERGTARNWLLAITADQGRKARRKSSRNSLALALTEAAAVTASERDLDVERAIRRLSERQRMAVHLHYYLGLRVVDVAAVMGCAEGTVKSTLADARSRLRTELGEDFR